MTCTVFTSSQKYLCQDQKSIRLRKILLCVLPTAGSHRPCSLGIFGSYCVQARSSTVRSTAGRCSLAMRRYHLHAPCCTQWYINYCVAIGERIKNVCADPTFKT